MNPEQNIKNAIAPCEHFHKIAFKNAVTFTKASCSVNEPQLSVHDLYAGVNQCKIPLFVCFTMIKFN